ncbi:MAG: hypothetical protein MRY76_05690 [Pseudomonadales bacterium]|nr:hypothetical protein [Pseudomonadales bacterium]
MARIAVITGDLINSTRVADSKAFKRQLDTLLARLQQRFDAEVATYRGDGFQVALDARHNALQLALLLRTGLIAASPDSENRWDARIAIAWGEADKEEMAKGDLDPASQIGPVYIESGRALDALGKQHLQAVTSGELPSLALNLSCRFADDIVNHLTAVEAEVLYYYMQDRGSHQSIADRLGKQRPTVTVALQRARYKLLARFVDDMDKMLRLSHE